MTRQYHKPIASLVILVDYTLDILDIKYDIDTKLLVCACIEGVQQKPYWYIVRHNSYGLPYIKRRGSLYALSNFIRL